jgi:hypothetical protein
MNGVEPYAWLKSTLEKIAAAHPRTHATAICIGPIN